jgi:ParB-like chromosome segregation protein Spo0J
MSKEVPNRLKDHASSVSDLMHIDPRKIIVVPGFNARDFTTPENIERVRLMSLSIAEVGVKTPVKVRFEDNKVLLVNGETRLRGTMLAIEHGADIDTIKCVPEDRGTSAADRDAELIFGNDGQKLNMLEQAIPIKRMLGHGWDVEKIAVRCMCSVQHVNQVLDLAEAPSEVHTMIRNGTVAATTALRTLQDVGASKVVAVLQKAAEVAKTNGKVKVTDKSVRSAQGRAKHLTEAQVTDLVSTMRKIVEDDRDKQTVEMIKAALTRVGVAIKAPATVINLKG